MARIGIFQTPSFVAFQALAGPLEALGHTVIDETHITDLSQVPIGAIDMAIFLGNPTGGDGFTPTSRTLMGQLWTLRQLPIFTQSDDANGVIPILSANCYGTLFGAEGGDVVPTGSDPLTVGWSTGVQQFEGGFNLGLVASRCDILILSPGTEVLATVAAAGQPWNGMPVYLRLKPNPGQFWLHWHNALLGDASWVADLVGYINANLVVTATIPTCTPSNCPPPNSCVDGMCFAPCVNGTCAPPATCVNGVCIGPCSPTTCPPPNQCVHGTCSPPCVNGQCTPPAVCQNGVCVAPCSPQNCPAPAQCVNGMCLFPCTPGTICPNGEPCPTSGFCGVTGAGGSLWPYVIAIGGPVIWGLVARLHELGKV